MYNHRCLDAWTCSLDIIDEVYDLTKSYPASEIYGLTSQMRRAAVSVATNIAEGFGRQTNKEKSHYLHISRGSLYELDTLLEISVRQQFLKDEFRYQVSEKINRCVRMLQGLIKKYMTTGVQPQKNEIAG